MTYPYPTPIYELGLSALPTDPLSSVSWTQIPANLVLGARITRGRQHELAQFEAGTAELDLDNRDGRFTPGNTTSPYYPNLVPMVRFRVRMTWSAVTFTLFCGYVQSWPMTWTDPSRSIAKVTAVDAFMWLALQRVDTSPFATEVGIDDPDAWWRLGDSGSNVAVDSSRLGRFPAQYQGNPTQGATGLIANDTDGAVAIAHSAGQRVFAAYPYLVSGFPVTFEFVVKTLAEHGSFKVLFSGLEGSSSGVTQAFQIAILDSVAAASFGSPAVAGNVAISIIRGGFRTLIVSSAVVDTNIATHVVVQMDSLSVGRIFVNGVSGYTTMSSTLAAFPIIANGWAIGNTPTTTYGDFGVNGTIDEFVIYYKTLSAARVAEHQAAAVGAWVLDDASARIGRLLDSFGWPSADRNLSSGVSLFTQSATSPETLLSYFQVVERTEAGAFFVAADGRLTFHGRYKPLFPPYTVSQATFGQGPGVTPYAAPFEDAVDDVDLWNEAGVTRLNGVRAVARDLASQQRYGRRVYPETTGTLAINDNDSRDYANWIVSHYKDPQVRVRKVVINPFSDPTNLYPQVLGRELRDRVTISAKVPQMGSPGSYTFTQDSHIERIEHALTPDSWTTTYGLSPAETKRYFILDDSTYGVLDTSALAF